MIYVLDTNTIIYVFKNMGNVAQKMKQISDDNLAIPSVVLYELQLGILKSSDPTKRIRLLSQLLQHTRVLPFAEKEAYYAAQIRRNLEQKGTPIGDYDILIAATALAHQATLVTHNTREFSRIENLHLTDWF